jgi:spore coat polysaccharide biosynthesis protein SpsF (cytidylyltransferase family)
VCIMQSRLEVKRLKKKATRKKRKKRKFSNLISFAIHRT